MCAIGIINALALVLETLHESVDEAKKKKKKKGRRERERKTHFREIVHEIGNEHTPLIS